MTHKLVVLLVTSIAIVAGLVPGLVAVDSGGVLPWSRWFASACGIVLLLAALPALTFSDLRPSLRATIIPLLVLALGGYAIIQTVSLSDGMLSSLSNGSYEAWHRWLEDSPLATSQSDFAVQNSISVFPKGSWDFAGLAMITAAMIWVGIIAGSSRKRALAVLVLVSVAGTGHAVAGIWQTVIDPNATLWGTPASSPYGFFVNRNNAGVFLLISMAASAGLIAWRFTALTGQKVGGYHFDSSAFLDLVSDRIAVSATSMFGVMGVAILVSGSRGAISGLIAAVAIAFGAFGEGRALKRIFAAIVILVLVGCVLFIKIELGSIFGRATVAESATQQTLTNEIRLQHWQDAMAAAVDYAPGGSGLGSYRFAYLPYQESSVAGWFVNADNLWLEWCVEGGLVAILLLIAIGFFFIRELLHLRNSIEPIDHGVVSSGWFFVSAVVISQTFDFGLTLAGAACCAGLLVGVVISRSNFQLNLDAIVPRSNRSSQPGRANIHTGILVSVAALILCCDLFASGHFRNTAVIDALVRNARIAATDGAGTDRAITQLSALQQRDYDLDLELAGLHHRRINRVIREQWRKADFLPELPGNENQSFVRGLAFLSKMISNQSELDSRSMERLQVFISSTNQLIEEDLLLGQQYAVAALAQSPLSAEARFLMADFALLGNHPTLVGTLLTQLDLLRGNAVDSMAVLAELAAVAGEMEVAKSAWTKLSEQRPESTPKYLLTAQLLGFSGLQTLIAENPVAWISVAKAMRDAELDQPALRSVVIERLASEVPQNKEERGRHYKLISDLYLLASDRVNAEEMLHQASDSNPFNSQLRMEYINFLKSAGKFSLAIIECDSAANDTGEKERFQQKKKEIQRLRTQELGE